MMNKIFGASWRTSVAGIGAGLMLILHNVADLPYTFGQVSELFGPEWKKRITIAAGIATGLLLVFGGVNSKDKRVTGGVKPNDVAPDAEPKSGARSALLVFLLIFATGALSFALASCATDTGNAAADRRGRITNAVGGEVFNALVKFGLNAGREALSGQNGQDASQAAFEAAGNLVTAEGVERVMAAAAGPQVGQASAAAFQMANPWTREESAYVLNTIGAAWQNANNQLAK